MEDHSSDVQAEWIESSANADPNASLKISRRNRLIERRIYVSLILAALISGWCVPDFYDWSGADQSRPAPVVGWVAIGILIFDALLVALLGALHWTQRWISDAQPLGRRFSIGQLLVATTAVAFLISIGQSISMVAFCTVLHIVALIGVVWLSIRSPGLRWRSMTILACQILPFAWLIRSGDLLKLSPEIFPMAIGLPTFLPLAILGNWFRLSIQNHGWLQMLPMLMGTLELALGVWIGTLGPKRFIAYAIGVLTFSLFGSFGFNAMMRM